VIFRQERRNIGEGKENNKERREEEETEGKERTREKSAKGRVYSDYSDRKGEISGGRKRKGGTEGKKKDPEKEKGRE
jgi:hypothetical protein